MTAAEAAAQDSLERSRKAHRPGAHAHNSAAERHRVFAAVLAARGEDRRAANNLQAAAMDNAAAVVYENQTD